MAKNALPSTTDTPKRKRKRMMSDAEVITILICFHFNSYRNFKHYYLGCVRIHWKHLFPQTFSYNRFVEVMPRCFVAMTMFLRLACFGECTGISFVDSTCIPVIHNKRQFNMKVFKDIATKGKSTMGWYVGFKLHLLCNEKGELINCLVRKSVDRQIQHFLVKCVKKTKNSGTNLRFRQSMPGTAAEKVSVRLTRNTILRSGHCLQ